MADDPHRDESRKDQDDSGLARMLSCGPAAAASAEIFWLAQRHEETAAFLAEALPRLSETVGGEFLAIVRPASSRWSVLAQAGDNKSLPTDLLAEALDRESAVSHTGWIAAPLETKVRRGELLVMYVGQSRCTKETERMANSLAATLARALETLEQSHARRRRIRRMETILEITSQWNRTTEMDTLLVQMAEAATRLLDADRASIFLWDQAAGTLVGRPALGVESGELRISDDAGIVGQVIQTGRPCRTGSSDEKEINHQVDTQTGYQTRSLLCVPLCGSDGQLFGAFEVLNKHEGEFTDQDEAALLELAYHAAVPLENTRQRQRLLAAHQQIVDQAAESAQLIGQCPAIEALQATIRRVADTELSILLLGENGTGKEIASRQIHYFSARRDQPCVAINCAAITETLLESELFGHEKGAFTDAHESRPGKFELATGGTIFLDEIGDMSLGGQAKLLRVLEEKIIFRVGGSTPIQTDTRVIAATNHNLAEMVGLKKFREDLYYRLNVVTLELPPLRERGNDILLLAEYFLNDFSKKAGRTPPRLTSSARKRLLAHVWPGNVRELRNLMERLAYLSQENKIEAEDLAFILSPSGDRVDFDSCNLPLAEASIQFQITYIRKAIDRAGGNVTEAAKNLGMHRSNLYRKMRQLKMATPDECSRQQRKSSNRL